MASDKKKKDASGFTAPDGFDVPIGKSEAKGWVAKAPGNVVCGKVLGKHQYKRKGGEVASYYQLELILPTLMNPSDGDGDDDQPEMVEAAVGTIVNLSENKALEDLSACMDIIRKGGEAAVWTVFIRKDPNRSSEGSHWVMAPIKMKVLKQPMTQPV